MILSMMYMNNGPMNHIHDYTPCRRAEGVGGGRDEGEGRKEGGMREKGGRREG